jgi:hypothetical protein
VRTPLRSLVLFAPLCLLAGLGAPAHADRDDDLLRRGAVVERALNDKAGVNASEVVRLRDGSSSARGIFKPVDGQRYTVLDLLSRVGHGSFAAREAAASDLAIALGVPYVPRTAVREVGGRRGSLQLWVEDAQRARPGGARPPARSARCRDGSGLRLLDRQL